MIKIKSKEYNQIPLYEDSALEPFKRDIFLYHESKVGKSLRPFFVKGLENSFTGVIKKVVGP